MNGKTRELGSALEKKLLQEQEESEYKESKEPDYDEEQELEEGHEKVLENLKKRKRKLQTMYFE